MTIILIVICFIVVMLIYGYLSNYHLTVSEYTITSDKVDEHIFIVLSDLHCCSFGKDNHRLIKRIDEISPEIIFIPGDLVTKYMYPEHKKIQRMLRFVKSLSEKYPVYFSPGNHEIRLYDYDRFKDEIRKMGVHYLENSSVDIQDSNIRVYGLDLNLGWYRSHDELSKEIIGELIGKKNADEKYFNILLAHDPRYFEAFVEWGADLTLSGHLHGGIIRLPFVGGVISPYMRIFPKYDAGEYEKDGKRMIISRGLGTHHIRLRFFNPPEVVVIRMKEEK